MVVLGIDLKTPNKHGLAAVTAVTLGAIALMSALVVTGIFGGADAITGVQGLLAGSLASAYGVSIMRHGWRGLLVMLGFGLAVIGMSVVATAVATVIA